MKVQIKVSPPDVVPDPHAWPGPAFALVLLHFVFCLSACRVNICDLNECYLPLLEILHFALYFGSWKGVSGVSEVAWSSQQSLGPQNGLRQRKTLPRMLLTTPLFTASSILIFIPILLLMLTSIHSKNCYLSASLLPGTTEPGKHRGESGERVAKMAIHGQNARFHLLRGHSSQHPLCLNGLH